MPIIIKGKNGLDNIHKYFVVVSIDKATGNIALVCKRFYASVIIRELELNNNPSTDSVSIAGDLLTPVAYLQII